MAATPPSDGSSAIERPKFKKLTCALSGKEYARRDLVSLDALRPSLADRIRKDHPELAFDALVSKAELGRYRSKYVEELLTAEHGDLTELEQIPLSPSHIRHERRSLRIGQV